MYRAGGKSRACADQNHTVSLPSLMDFFFRFTQEGTQRSPNTMGGLLVFHAESRFSMNHRSSRSQRRPYGSFQPNYHQSSGLSGSQVVNNKINERQRFLNLSSRQGSRNEIIDAHFNYKGNCKTKQRLEMISLILLSFSRRQWGRNRE